ncbi:diphosphomevalonate decarboxylase [Apilactobacillus quenuiae]|uniref:diphosphomevalonate decarboxylase n=1 Tax=Apilactobacillus quenuiae TaxID=2008377 RepID=UPI000D0217CC|nr:diphosphomevalonate decarboxylase [Apilactobacillus quenuiae]
MSLDNKSITARAHTNIALVKYWGKKDEKLIIPNNSSISLTLDEFYTETTVKFDDNLYEDVMYLDNTKIDNMQPISNFMNIVRKLSDTNKFAKINSYNHVPTSAGLASSASGFAALSAAASKAAGLNLNNIELSKLARRGSGSATRSVYGGFSEWKHGTDNDTSYAVSIQDPVKMDINMIAIILNNQPKKISSRKGMKMSVNTSPYYKAWEQQTTRDLKSVKNAIYNNDFTTLGKTAELNSMRMHALTLSSDPSYLYLNKDSLLVIDYVKSLREKGIECYYTMDAGPNVKVICQSKNIEKIKLYLLQSFDEENIKISKPGGSIKYL